MSSYYAALFVNCKVVNLLETLTISLHLKIFLLILEINYTSLLAFEGVLQGKIVFTQKILRSLKISSTLGLLQSVQGFGPIGSKLVTCNFIHLAVQELLAACYISQLEPAEHSKQLQVLLKENLKSPVLQFYAGLTGLADEGVQNLIVQFVNRDCLLSFLYCIFEAQLCDQSFYLQIIDSLESKLDLSYATLSPTDSLSVNYFLSSIRTVERGLALNISYCSIDNHSLCLLLGVSDEISSESSALQSVETLHVNFITNSEVDCLARALDISPDNTLKKLSVGVINSSLKKLLEALPRHQVLKELDLQWVVSHPEKSLKEIGELVGRSMVKRLRLIVSLYEPLQIEEWVESGKNLIYSLQYSQVNYLLINIIALEEGDYSESVETELHRSLQEAVSSVNSKRNKTSLPILQFMICV